MAASARSAFISYVRRRGEPDGGQTDTVQPPKLPSVTSSFDNSLNTDSELSDGYATQQMLAKFTNSSKELCYSGLRGTIKICRPGGGGESDAVMTLHIYTPSKFPLIFALVILDFSKNHGISEKSRMTRA
jgi:hypothetical protein